MIADRAPDFALLDVGLVRGEAVMHLLADLHREGSTICMVTHDPRFAKHAQREVHLFDGKVVSETN